MKISLLGQFGSGNSGNDGSLESMLAYLRDLRPEARLLCICSNPSAVEARYNIPSVSIGGAAPSGRFFVLLNRSLARFPKRIASLVAGLVNLGGVDLMIVPGTGILDDFQETAFGWPFVIFWWCLAARLRRAEIAFVSIGAGPIKGRLSRWFLRSAARMAKYRSYRDDYSMEYMRALGVDVSRDHRYPDIAFSLPAPHDRGDDTARPNLSVGVGIMHYRGWQRNHPNGNIIYETYIAKIAAFVSWLAGEGYRVRMFIGDAADHHACDDIMALLQKSLTPEDLGRIDIGTGLSLHDVMKEISTVDLAVVSRYHNLVCALKLARPTISLGYAEKNDHLMDDFGQKKFSMHIETFEVDRLVALVQSILGDIDALKQRIARVNDSLQAQLAEQKQLLGLHVLPHPKPQQGKRPRDA